MSQQPAPQFLTDVGDLSWVMGLINWLVDRQIIPDWVAALLIFTLSMFVPAVRGNPQVQSDIEDLHKAWDQYAAVHPRVVPYLKAHRP